MIRCEIDQKNPSQVETTVLYNGKNLLPDGRPVLVRCFGRNSLPEDESTMRNLMGHIQSQRPEFTTVYSTVVFQLRKMGIGEAEVRAIVQNLPAGQKSHFFQALMGKNNAVALLAVYPDTHNPDQIYDIRMARVEL